MRVLIYKDPYTENIFLAWIKFKHNFFYKIYSLTLIILWYFQNNLSQGGDILMDSANSVFTGA